MSAPGRLLSIMAHQDDWELTTAGLWAKLRKRGVKFTGLVVSTTDGRSGHHRMSPAQTARTRLAEGRKAAATLGCNFRLLADARGRTFWNGQIEPDIRTRGAIWRLIRDYRPDVIFCPPRPADWRAGCHSDHVVTAELVWSVAYQLSVPHAFPQNGMGRERTPLKSPLIVAAYDNYLKGAGWDVAVDVGDVFERKLDALACHRSQVFSWLPWVGGYPAPRDRMELGAILSRRMQAQARMAGLRTGRLHELFFLTGWGRRATRADLATWFPGAKVSATGRRQLG